MWKNMYQITCFNITVLNFLRIVEIHLTKNKLVLYGIQEEVLYIDENLKYENKYSYHHTTTAKILKYFENLKSLFTLEYQDTIKCVDSLCIAS